MRKTILITLLLLVTLSTGAAGQRANRTDLRDLAKYTIAVHPLTLFNSGLRLDFEMQLKSDDQWLQMGLIGYYSAKTRYEEQDDFIGYPMFGGMWDNNVSYFRGFGVAVGYKYFFNRARTLYLSAGLEYRYVNVASFAPNYGNEYDPNNWDFYDFSSRDYTVGIKKESFNKFLGKFCVGVQSSLTHRLFVDVYGGLGYMNGFSSGSTKVRRGVGMGKIDYAGITLVGGFRVGVTIGLPKKRRE